MKKLKKYCFLSMFSMSLALFFLGLNLGNLEAATYYLDGSNGNDSNPGTLASPWKTVSKANSTLHAGDSVYIKAGIYHETINPNNSGTLGNLITYEAYPGEAPIIDGTTYGVLLEGSDGDEKQYIKIKGIKFHDQRRRWFDLLYADYIYFEDCDFDYASVRNEYEISWLENCSHLTFNNCTWNASHIPEDSNVQNDLLGLRDVTHSLFNSCTFGDVSHSAVYYWGTGIQYIVWQDCTFTNKWRHGLTVRNSRNLVQGCTFAQIGRNNDTCPWEGDRNRVTSALYLMSTSHSIIRKNIFYACDTPLHPSTTYSAPSYNKIYNNTIYNTDKCDGNHAIGSGTGYNSGGHAIFGQAHQYTFSYNSFVNNIIWKVEQPIKIKLYALPGGGAQPNNNIIAYNLIGDPTNPDSIKWGSSTNTVAWHDLNNPDGWDSNSFFGNVDPKFVDADNNIFSLQSDSVCIDSGQFLTTVTSATGSGTIFIVADAGFFCDGWGIITGDVIQIEGSTATATITNIHYSSNTITVNTTLSWTQGDGVALRYSRSAPDIGAYEQTENVSPPLNLRISVLN